MSALIRLKVYINKLINSLNNYASQPNAKESVIEMRNKDIKELVEIYNGLNEFKYPKTWKELEAKMAIHRAEDPSLTSHSINVKYCQNSTRYSLIEQYIKDDNDEF